MKLNKPQSSTYCASIVKIEKVYPLEGRDKLNGTRVFDNQVLISKDVEPGQIGLFFPVETALSKEFLSANNLFKDSTLNRNSTKSGYFESSGRIKCVKFGGHPSEGFFMEIDAVRALGVTPNQFAIGDEFDMINDIPVCTKYVVKQNNTPGQGGKGKKGSKYVKVSKLVDGQFKFHKDTPQLYKNLHVLRMDSIVSISDKWHGTSAISSRLISKKSLSYSERLLKRLGFNIIDTVYDKLFSSRTVIRNDDMNPDRAVKDDCRSHADNILQKHLKDGMSIYYELVGYEKSGSMIQKPYDYGCVVPKPKETYEEGKHYKIYIYRITYTNFSGDVFEFSAQQVQQWCNDRELRPVKELFYGKIAELSFEFPDLILAEDQENWRTYFIKGLKQKYLEKDCEVCNNKLPSEGIVLRVEDIGIKAYKLKSTRFLERESKSLDKGIVDTESDS